MSSQYTGPFRQLVPMTGLPERGAVRDEQLLIQENAGIITENGLIRETGTHEELLEKARQENVEINLLEREYVVLPGFIDSHTHICFGGSRARDYAMRNAGKSYLEIARAGGGIWDTVTKTREASEEELAKLTARRANELLQRGITTAEVKSGYGLSVNQELKMLRAIRTAAENTACTLVPTCLAAHMVPRDYDGTPEEYLREIIDHLFPVIKSEGLARRVDAFIEESAFTSENIQPYFKRAAEMGFDITVHADQFHTGGSEVAVEFRAVSADHLEASGEQEISMLAGSDTIATALPGASVGLGMAFTPARQILDEGGVVAIASDWNPGSAPMGDLLTQASLLGTFGKLSNAEVLAGITERAAKALRLEKAGRLEAGYMADMVLFETSDFNDILYRQGQLKPAMVIKKGKKVYSIHDV